MMESNELITPEPEEIQTNEEQLSPSNEETQHEEETQHIDEEVAEDSVIEKEQAVETWQSTSEEPATEPEPSMKEMIAEIEEKEISVEEPELEEHEEVKRDEKSEHTPTEENIESEYAQLSYEDAVRALEFVVGEPDFNSIKLKVSILRSKIMEFIKQEKNRALDLFLTEGGIKEEFEAEVSDLEKRFQTAFQRFKENKAKFLENIELEKSKNLGIKQNIINRLKELIETDTSNLKLLNDKFKECQDAWRETGPVPQSESNNLWQNYHFYVEKFYDILRINKELRSLDYKKNLEQKMALCEQAEELIVDQSINKSFKKLQELHEKWKEIGPVPEDKHEEIWERFKNASDSINQRRRDYYEKLFTEQQNNYKAKVLLCEKAEELIAKEAVNINESKAIGEQLAELLKMWKTIGQAPTKVNEEIWLRFKTTIDKNYEGRKEQQKQAQELLMQNYNLKLDLAIRAEGIADRTDWKNATAEMMDLQKEWKTIGQVPYKLSDKVWTRFKTACDKFFETKNSFFKDRDENETENLKLKEALIEKINNQTFGEDKNENLEVLKSLQREWTEIGFVPKKNQDSIYTRYKEAINKHFSALKINMEEKHAEKYRTHINAVLNKGNSGQLLSKEKNYLIHKMNAIKDEVRLWENNLGFFAHSKNADLLREEFNKKIEIGKKEIKDLEYKIRLLNNPPKKEKDNAETEETSEEKPKEE